MYPFLSCSMLLNDSNGILAVILATVYVNIDTAFMYQELFNLLFELLEDATGSPICWQHIHGEGLEVVIAEVARTILVASRLPENLWPQAVSHAVFVVNRLCATSRHLVWIYLPKYPSARFWLTEGIQILWNLLIMLQIHRV